MQNRKELFARIELKANNRKEKWENINDLYKEFYIKWAIILNKLLESNVKRGDYWLSISNFLRCVINNKNIIEPRTLPITNMIKKETDKKPFFHLFTLYELYKAKKKKKKSEAVDYSKWKICICKGVLLIIIKN